MLTPRHMIALSDEKLTCPHHPVHLCEQLWGTSSHLHHMKTVSASSEEYISAKTEVLSDSKPELCDRVLG